MAPARVDEYVLQTRIRAVDGHMLQQDISICHLPSASECGAVLGSSIQPDVDGTQLEVDSCGHHHTAKHTAFVPHTEDTLPAECTTW
jgi:hypothetical protein